MSRRGAGRRARSVALLAVSILVLPPVAGALRAQGACEQTEVRDYLAGLRWPRPAQPAPPPAAWNLCVSGSQKTPKAVLEFFARLRSAPAAPEAASHDAWLLKGSQPPNTVTREVLNGWRANLHGPATPQRFENLPYQALLGSLALMVLDATSGLERLRIPSVQRLQRALREPVSWEGVEGALDEFRYVPIWGAQGAGGPALAGLRAQVANLDPAVLATGCAGPIVAEIAAGGRPDVYWKRIEPRLRSLARCAGEVRPPAHQVVRVSLPPGCSSRVCAAMDRWNRSGEAARWAEVREALRAAASSLETRIGGLAADLPGGIDWSRVRAAVDGVRDAASRQDRPPDGAAAPDLAAVVAGVEDLAARLDGLDTIAAYRKALRHLLAGNPDLAKRQIEAARPDWKTRPELVAAYLAAAYWAGGDSAVEQVCRGQGFDCRQARVGQETRRVERLLGLAEGALGAGQIS